MNEVPSLKRLREGGPFHVKIKTPAGTEWITTGQTSRRAALEVCDRAKLRDLQMAASANILTAEVVGRLTTGGRLTFRNALEAWLVECSTRLAPLSVDAYRRSISGLLDDFGCWDKPLPSIDHHALNRWVNAPTTYSGRARRKILSGVFFTYCQNMGLLLGNPAKLTKVRVRDIPVELREAKKAEPFTEDEYRTLRDSPFCHPFLRSAIPISYWTGLRLVDIGTMEWASIERNGFRVFQKKTGNKVLIPFADTCGGEEDLRRAIAGIARTDERYCFPKECMFLQDPIAHSLPGKWFHALCKKHGISGKSFHGLRHTCAIRLRNLGKSLPQVAGIMGHSNEEQTRYYADHRRKALAEPFLPDCV